MRKTLLLLLFLPFFSEAQNYVDLMRIGYGQTLNNDFEGSLESTEVKSLEADLTFPLVINEKQALITGLTFSRNRLQLFPAGMHTNLFSTTLKIGMASTWSEKWST
ncbi:MAG: hypothetical protein HKN48_02235, partial [Flavobacteriaceae bacterium]|nr:hypothetical protein [Flavobacteriaceae bacterium]